MDVVPGRRRAVYSLRPEIATRLAASMQRRTSGAAQPHKVRPVLHSGLGRWGWFRLGNGNRRRAITDQIELRSRGD